MTTLVTGGLGFIGLHTARALLDLGEDVVLTQYRVARAPSFLQDEFGKRAFVEPLDVRNREQLMDIGRHHRITGIMHLAVPPVLGLTPEDDYTINMTGLLNIMEAAHIWEVTRLGIASSRAIYAGVREAPLPETAPMRIAATSPTEAFKKAYEILGSHYAQRTGIETIMLRIAGFWGPTYHSMANNPSRLVHAALKGEVPTWRGENFADDEADMCYVKDGGRALALLQVTPKLNHTVYNVGEGRMTKNRELVEAVRDVIPGFKAELKPGNSPNFIRGQHGDITRLRQDTGFEPAWPLGKAIPDYIEWLRSGNRE